MGLETTVNWIEDLNENWPLGSDAPSTLDNHDRHIKTALKNQLPNLGAEAVTKTAAEINDLAPQASPTLTDPVLNGSVTGDSPKVLLNQKVVNIGDWDMDTTNFVQVAHGLTFSKIVLIHVTILIDDDVGDIGYEYFDGTGLSSISFGTTNVSINRVTGGLFDSTNFDKTSYNRGYITILYTD